MYNFILIDDNKIDLLIASKAISLSGIDFENIKEFTNAAKALEYIAENRSAFHTIMLIDIRMPLMDGFEFIEKFCEFSPEIQADFTCMFLTSSLNDLDKLRAANYPVIKSFINKPLTSVKLKEVLTSLSLI